MSTHLRELRKRLHASQQVGDALLTRLQVQALGLQAEDVTTEIIANAYVKLAGMQMKWCELELALLRESARQQEFRVQRASKEEQKEAAHHLPPEPLNDEEWRVLHAMFSAEHDTKVA